MLKEWIDTWLQTSRDSKPNNTRTIYDSVTRPALKAFHTVQCEEANLDLLMDLPPTNYFLSPTFNFQALTAINNNAIAFAYLSEELRSDKDVVLVAVKKDGSSLNYISEELKCDKEIVYLLKDFLIENKEDFISSYEALVAYEREDELKQRLIEKENLSKSKIKI